MCAGSTPTYIVHISFTYCTYNFGSHGNVEVQIILVKILMILVQSDWLILTGVTTHKSFVVLVVISTSYNYSNSQSDIRS